MGEGNGKLFLHFVRHGDVENPDQILYGKKPGFGLSAKGRNQAQVASEKLITTIFHNDAALEQLWKVWCTPMARTRETAEPFSKKVRKDINVSELINEVITIYEGKPLTELKRIDFDIYSTLTPKQKEQGYETWEDMVRRTKLFITDTCYLPWKEECNADNIRHAVIFTHGDIILATKSLLQIPQSLIATKDLSNCQRDASADYPENGGIFSVCISHDCKFIRN
eukprot:TRINITY_DN17742_c0_g1_i1.p1 TRINITY_DN17742_c0_g1~~TRINITY_DN17742_c0_g1_i1.p1  ORF type:complete len:233 (+),score=24.19 TRINITY_DN17742_c0_g1_i1:29-700(+)